MVSVRDRVLVAWLVGKHDTVGREYICLDPNRFGTFSFTTYGPTLIRTDGYSASEYGRGEGITSHSILAGDSAR